jgi:histidine triad (HIT) family protein
MEHEKTLFEKIATHEIPAAIVYEDEHTVAFLDIKPVQSGHVLVIPRIAYPNIIETPDETVTSIMRTVKKVAEAQREALGAEGSNLIFNSGEAAGQVIFHTHAHVIPRFKDDGIKGLPQNPYENEGKMEKVANKLTAFLNSA